MKKKILMCFVFLLISGTMVTALIVFKDIDGSIAFSFVICFIILLFLCMFYFLFLLIVEIRKLKGSELRKIVYKFIVYFIFLCLINYIVDTIFKSLEFDLYNIFSTSLSLSFGLVAIDLVFNKKTD